MSHGVRFGVCFPEVARVVVLCCVASAGWGQIGDIVATSASSFTMGLPSKGSLATLFLSGIQVNGVVAADGAPLPFELAGVRVTLDGASAPLWPSLRSAVISRSIFRFPRKSPG